MHGYDKEMNSDSPLEEVTWGLGRGRETRDPSKVAGL